MFLIHYCVRSYTLTYVYKKAAHVCVGVPLPLLSVMIFIQYDAENFIYTGVFTMRRLSNLYFIYITYMCYEEGNQATSVFENKKDIQSFVRNRDDSIVFLVVDY